MATLLWMLLSLYPFLARSQSGDDGESVDVDCWSLMTMLQTSLICVLSEYDLDICEKFATLCWQEEGLVCSNATMKSNRFTFEELSPVPLYTLQIQLNGGRHQTQTFRLIKIVKIPTPEIENATYMLDEAVIHIQYMHAFVTEPEFQVEFWGDRSNSKMIKSTGQVIRIGGHMLGDSEIYNVHVRAKPVDYFGGNWTEWSKVKSFRVKGPDAPFVLYVLLCITPVVFAAVGFLILRKKAIKACLFPDIPDPKTTLAQIYRQKEHLPVSFSPEIFKDVIIYPVVLTEKKFTSDFGDNQGDTTDSCDEDFKCSSTLMCESQDEDDQSLNSKSSQMTMKLLGECASVEDVHENPGCQSVAALQRNSKDETYVTMSSLYKTQ